MPRKKNGVNPIYLQKTLDPTPILMLKSARLGCDISATPVGSKSGCGISTTPGLYLGLYQSLT